MQYKTIVLALLQERPEMHEELRKNRKLLPTLETYAHQLRSNHEDSMQTISEARPNSDPAQIASEAMELALKDLEERLPTGSSLSGNEPQSLDAAMDYIRNHTSRA